MQHFILRRDTIMVHTYAYARAWLRNVDICTQPRTHLPSLSTPLSLSVPCVCVCVYLFIVSLCVCFIHAYACLNGTRGDVDKNMVTPGYSRIVRNLTTWKIRQRGPPFGGLFESDFTFLSLHDYSLRHFVEN